jgi:hypothetical protein
MRPNLSGNDGPREEHLRCAGCGCSEVHHERVEVFERSEDAEEGLHIVIEGLKFTKDSSLEGNPSRRRDGLLIQFWCEQCDEKSVLAISQHKGVTYVDWETVQRREEIRREDEARYKALCDRFAVRREWDVREFPF